MSRQALAIRHVHFQHLGVFDAVLKAVGYDVRYCDVTTPEFLTLDASAPDLLLVLGGPVGVYDRPLYPFLDTELALLKSRMRANRPTFGICLGAQQMAAALGANVHATGFKEIGFAPLALTVEGEAGPLHHLKDVPVLHWHGDTFDMPNDTSRLAATSPSPNQAFSRGRNIMALQFHAEVDAAIDIEYWLVGHAVELATAKADIHRIRRDAALYGPTLKTAACKMFEQWLNGLCNQDDPTASRESLGDRLIKAYPNSN